MYNFGMLFDELELEDANLQVTKKKKTSNRAPNDTVNVVPITKLLEVMKPSQEPEVIPACLDSGRDLKTPSSAGAASPLRH
jgi:hypothetical protein